MKTPPFLLPLLLATLAANAEVSPVRISVELSQKTAIAGSQSARAPKDTHDKTQTRSLKITLDNNSTQSFDGLVVKYWFTGHTEGSHEQKVLKEGERKASLTPRGKEVVESEEASSHYIEEHYPPSKGGKGGGAQKKIPASGEKMTGYAVRVMAADKVLAEYCSEPSIKALIDGGAHAAAPAPAAGKTPPAKK